MAVTKEKAGWAGSGRGWQSERGSPAGCWLKGGPPLSAACWSSCLPSCSFDSDSDSGCASPGWGCGSWSRC